MSVANSSMGKDMGGIDFAAHKGKNIANSTLIRTVIRGLLKNGHKKTPQENSYGVWDRKKALILSYQRLFFRRYLILNLTPRSLPPKNIVLPTNSMFSYPEAGNGYLLLMVRRKGLETLWSCSVKPSRAALTRAAFNCSSLFADIKIIRTRRCGSDYSSLVRRKGLEPPTY